MYRKLQKQIPCMQDLQDTLPTTLSPNNDKSPALPPGTRLSSVATSGMPAAGSTGTVVTKREGVGVAVFAFTAVAAAVLLMMVAGLIVTLKRRRHLAPAPTNGVDGSHFHVCIFLY